MKPNDDMKEIIIKILKAHPEGLTVADLSKLIKAHRQTVTKYLFELIGANIVRRRWVGASSLHYLKKDFER